MSLGEIREEIGALVSGRVGIADGVLPPILFLGTNSIWGVVPAAIVGVGSALAISAWRLVRGKPIRFAVAGLFGSILAAFLALRSGTAADYFLPGIITGAGTSLLILVSLLLGKPFVAWTSWITRGWPIDWYWHPRVRPAYSRVTWLWFAFFSARALIQFQLYLESNTAMLGVARVILGWPALVILLGGTYVLGRRWLTALAGPSVEEFESGQAQPWEGQANGF